jgi:Zn-dependent protease
MGGAVLAWVLPRSLLPAIEFLNRWGFVILLGLLVTGTLGVLLTPGYIVANYWMKALSSLVAT